jgi:outer membrane protein OmpA-like peptidoglycan-associated protein
MAERYGVSDGLIKPYPGFRTGLGYAWKKFRFSLETGYTYIAGTNPLVLDITLIPLTFKAGYVFSPWKALSITPVVGTGLAVVSVTHYETAIDMLLGRQSRSSNRSVLLNAGVRAGWSCTPALELYAGAGLDCVVETGGLIPLPAVELGVLIKPFRFGEKRDVKPAGTELINIPEIVVPEIAGPVEEPEPVPEAETPAEPVRVVRVLHFPAERAVPVRSHLVELDAAAELLRASPELSVTLRGYTAPYGTPGGRRALSERRARFCADYLEREQGIERGRITVEWYGADKEPEAAAGEDRRRRCVEIIMKPVSPAGTGPEAGTAIPEEGGV